MNASMTKFFYKLVYSKKAPGLEYPNNWVGKVDSVLFCLTTEKNRIKFSNGTK